MSRPTPAVLAFLESLHVSDAFSPAAAVEAGDTPANALNRARSGGWAQQLGQTWCLTAEGRAAVEAYRAEIAE